MFVPIGSGENVRSLIHERDLVRAAILAEERNTTSGAIYNVTDGELHAIRDINAAIAAALHRRPPRVSIAATPARHLFHLIDRATRILGVRSPVSASTVDKYLERVAVDSSKIQRELGFKPEVGLREGWVETVAAFQRA